MGVVPFRSFTLDAQLSPAPIQATWVTAGRPNASNVILSRSTDGAAYTMVWECTAGAFEWTYDCDETVYILEGSITLSDAGNPARRLNAGESVFFPKGAKVAWQVDAHVRKLAFMHEVLPSPVSAGMKAYRRVRGLAHKFSLSRLAAAGRGLRPALAGTPLGEPTA